MADLFGGGAQKLAQENKQNRSLAAFSRQQAELDEGSAARFRRRGKGLLTYIKQGGTNKMGGAAS